MRDWRKITDLNARRRARYSQDSAYRERILRYYQTTNQKLKKSARNRRRWKTDPSYRISKKAYKSQPHVMARRRLNMKLRRASNPAYVMAARERARMWYQANKVRARVTRRKYYEANRAAIYAWTKEWRARN